MNAGNSHVKMFKAHVEISFACDVLCNIWFTCEIVVSMIKNENFTWEITPPQQPHFDESKVMQTVVW